MRLNLRVSRMDPGTGEAGLVTYPVDGLAPSMSILDALDVLNESLVAAGERAISFESDCREGICGACGIVVDGFAQGPQRNTPACHQRLSSFQDGQTVVIQPFGAAAFPVLADLVVDRLALDRVIEAGGYVSVDVGTAPVAESLVASGPRVEAALDFAACIGCGACVAACPNGSAQLFVGAKLMHLSLLPVPELERSARAQNMIAVADALFGPCSSYGECALACPAQVPLVAIAAVGHERLRASLKRKIRR